MDRGTKFREWCRENGLTAGQIAEKIGSSKSTVYAYFRGVRVPNRATMRRMERELGIDARRMFWD